MINQLRKVRKKLLAQGKLRRYFIYAIGEILLVVTGILIALQLNNWNLNRSNKNIEIQYYETIKNQLEQDLNAILGNMDYNQRYLDQFSYAKKLIIINNRSKIDTLGRISLNMKYYSDFRRKSNVYQTLISSGEIKLINNHDVNEKLQSLEEVYVYINRLEEIHRDVIIFQIIPMVSQIIRMDPLKIEKPEALYNYKFQNNFELLIELMIEKMGIYKQAENDINTAIKHINQELVDKK